MALNKVTESEFFTPEENDLQILRHFFIVDFGIIQKVNSDNTVDVEHAVIPVSYNVEDGTESELPTTITKNIELLFLGSGYGKQNFTAQVNDVVLLLGSKQYVAKVNGLNRAGVADVHLSYRQENMKALLLSTKASVNINITINDSKYQLDAGTKDIEEKAKNITLDTSGSIGEVNLKTALATQQMKTDGTISFNGGTTEAFVKGETLRLLLVGILSALATFSDGLTTTNLGLKASALNTYMTTAQASVSNIKSTKIFGV